MSEQDLRDEIAALRRKVQEQALELDQLRGELWQLQHPTSKDEAGTVPAQDSTEAA